MDFIHSVNYAKIYKQIMQIQKNNAEIRDLFYEQSNQAIKMILTKDLSKFFDTDDLAKLHFITIDSFVPEFLVKICNVYDKPPAFRFQDDVDEATQNNFIALMNEVNLLQVFQGTMHKMKLHNTILAHVKYFKDLDKIFIENDYNVGTCKITPYEGYPLEPVHIGYPTITANEQMIWVNWDRLRKEHYYTAEEPMYDYDRKDVTNTKIKINGNSDFKGPNLWPWIVYRNRIDNMEFWGNGRDDLIDLVRSVNILLTICDDDTIRQTLRILILNFDPRGTQGEKGQFKTGMEHPLFKENDIPGQQNNPDGKILSADLYNDQIIGFIEKMTDIIAHLNNVENPIKAQLEQNLSGVAIRLKNEPLVRQWNKDIGILRKPDMELIGKIVEVNNYYRKTKIDESILEKLTIVYQEPTIVTDDVAEYSLEKEKWQDGTSSPIEYMMRKDPALTEEKAKKKLEENRALYDELFGISFNVNPAGDNANLNMGQ